MPDRGPDGRWRIASAWALSIAGHVALAASGGVLVARGFAPDAPNEALPPPAGDIPIEMELPLVATSSATGSVKLEQPEGRIDPAPPSGGEAVPRPDTGSRGRGGDDEVDRAAVNLADRDDETTLASEVRSRWDRSQVQRLRTGRDRSSPEDWRAAENSTELTFVADGVGHRLERRPPAPSDPASGARAAPPASRAGGALPREPADAGEGARRIAAASESGAMGGDAAAAGQKLASAGVGVHDGRPGSDHRASAAVARARPLVARAEAAFPANVPGEARDRIDSEQEVAEALQSIVHASTAGGLLGPGRGGEAWPGPAGAGGRRGAGSVSTALGSGRGDRGAPDPVDAMRTTYVGRVLAKIHPLWRDAFPRWAALEGRQGTTIVTFVLRADGSVASATVTRPSGIPEFDENCRQAVLRGAPYGPLPPELGSSFRWAMPFEARNPAVRPPVEPPSPEPASP